MSDVFNLNEYHETALNQSLDKKGQETFGNERGDTDSILSSATQEQKDILNQNISDKGVEESIQQTVNYTPINRYFDFTDATDVQQQFKKEHPLSLKDTFNTATQPILSTEGITDEEKKRAIELQNEKIRNARSVLSKINAFNKVSKKQIESFNEYYKATKEKNPNIKDDVLDRLYMDKAVKTTAQMFDENGIIRQEILDNPLFMLNVDSDTYKSLANSFNVANNTWSFSNGWKGEKYRRVLDLQLTRGEITPEQYNQTIGAVNARYSNEDESDTIKTMGQIISGMVQPYTDNLLLSGALLGATILSRGKLSPLMLAPSAIDLYQREQAQQYNDIWLIEQNKKAQGKAYKEIDRNEIAKQTRLSSLAQTGIEFVTDLITGKILSPVAKAGGKYLMPKVLKVLSKDKNLKNLIDNTRDFMGTGKHEDALKLAKQINFEQRKRYGGIIAKSLGVMAGNTTTETAGEVAQNIIHNYTVNALTGQNYTFEDAQKDTAETISNVGLPIFALMALSHGARTTADLAITEIRGHSLVNNIKGIIANENMINTTLANRDGEINQAVIDELSEGKGLLYSRIYFSTDDVRNALRDNGIDENTLDENSKALLFGKADYETNYMTASQYGKIPENVRRALDDVVTDKDGKMYSEEVRKLLSDEKLQEISLRYEEQERFKENNRKPLNDFNKKVYNALIKNKVNQKLSQRIANLYTAFITSMSNQTRLPVADILKDYEPSFKFIKEQRAKELATQNNNKASYNIQDNEVSFDENNDFESSLHESAHFFLHTIKSMVDRGLIDKSIMNDLNAWYGKDVSQIDINSDEYTKLQEQFVSAFIHGLITNDVKTNNNSLFKNFKEYLTNLNTSDLFNSYSPKITKDEYLKKGFEDTYGMERKKADDSFNSFVNSLFVSEMQGEIARQDRQPIRELMSTVLDSSVFTTDEKNKFVEDLGVYDLTDEKIQDELNKFMLEMLMLNERDKNKITSYLKDFYGKHKELQSDEITNKIMKLLDRYHDYIDEAERKIINNPTETEMFVANVTRVLGKSRVDVSGLDLSANEKTRINRLGFRIIEKSNVATKATWLFNTLQHNDFIRKHKEIKSARDMFKFLASVLSPRERAIIEAEKLYKDDLTDIISTSRSAIENNIAKIFSKRGNVILKAFHNLTKDKKSIKELDEQIEKTARAEVFRTKWKDASPNSSQGNARNQSVKANKELVKGNIGQAYQHVQAMKYHADKSVIIADMKNEILKTFIKVRQMIRRSDKNLSKTYDADILKLNNLIAYKLGLTKKPKFDLSNIDIDALKVNAVGLNAELIDSAVDFISNDKLGFYKDMTIGDLLVVRDLMKALIENARSVKTIELNGKTQSIDAFHERMKESLARHKSNGKEFNTTVKGGTDTFVKKGLFNKLKDSYRKYKYLTTLVEQFCQTVDGSITGGAFHDLFQMVRDAVTQRNLAFHRTQQRLTEALNKIYCKKRAPIECQEFKFSEEIRKATGADHLVLGIGEFENRIEHQLIGIMLHCGTNYNKFINSTFEGKTFSEKEKCFRNWLQSMIKQNILTKEIMDCVQEIWNINKDLEPLANKATKQARGYSFNSLEQHDFTLTFSDGKSVLYHGGYVPALENKDVTKSLYNINETLDKNLREMQKLSGLRNPSFTKQRTSDTKSKTLCFDPVLLIAKTSDVINYSYIMPSVVQVQKILQHDNIRKELDDKFPDVYKEVFEPWLFSCATMTTQVGSSAPFMDTLLTISRNIVSGVMFMNINNAVQQLSNIPAIATYIKPKYLIRNIDKPFFVRQKAREISAKSDFMKTRFAQTHDSLNVIENEILTNVRNFESNKLKAKAVLKYFKYFNAKNYYFLQKFMQDHIDVFTWLSAYEQAITESDIKLKEEFGGKIVLSENGNAVSIDSDKEILEAYKTKLNQNEINACRFADSIVRVTQSSFDVSDISKISRGTAFQKLIATFGNYFYTMAQLTSSALSISAKNSSSQLQYRLLQAQIIFCSLIAPAVVAEIINQTIGTGNLLQWNDNDDETKEKVYWAIALAPLKMNLASKPVVGKIAQETVDEWILGNKARSDLLSVPVFTALQNIGNSAINVLDPNKEAKGRDIKALAQAISASVGMPMFNIVGKLVGNLYDVEEGNIDYSDIDYQTLEFIRSMFGSYSEVTKTN